MRWDLINYLIEQNGYRDYLEIGVQDYYSCCAKINATNKTTVDPSPRNLCDYVMTSDKFFETVSNDNPIFDIVFIDGLHHWDQVMRDVENSLKHLHPAGTIVVHDSLPHTEDMQLRDDHGREWTGDVWKAIAKLKMSRQDLTINTVNHDYGCAIITKSPSKVVDSFGLDLNWENYLKHKNYWLGVIEESEFYELYRQN